jgi:hypothetical protein
LEVRSISETERSRYLLGLCSPAEHERIESEYFEDDVAFQQMLAAEDDLFDAFGRGELEREERRRFEKSFASSMAGRDRVKFARAFADAISPPRPVESSFRIFQSPVLLRTATIAATIVFVALFGWLVIDRLRMVTELRELRAASAKLRSEAEALQQNTTNPGIRTAEAAVQVPDRRTQAHQSRRRESERTGTQPAQHLPEVKNAAEEIRGLKAEEGEQLVNRTEATLGNKFVNRQITQLPLEARNPLNLQSLQPAITRPGYVAGVRTDQSNVTLDGVDVPLNSYLLTPTKNRETTILIPNSLNWIRFQLELETAAIHEDYRVTLTTDDRTVTPVDWTEPPTPNQTIIDTPVISTGDLPSGDYVLVLMGKESDGSFVKIANYHFRVVKYD